MSYLYNTDWQKIFRYMSEKHWGRASQLKFLENFSDTKTMYHTLKQSIFLEKDLLKSSDQTKTRVISFLDTDYPKLLKEIDDPPAFLFIRGKDLEYQENLTVSIIGSRNPTPYGEKVANILVQSFRYKAMTVISGMANGIDSIAQKAALQNQMNTIAVLGTGVDICYPANQFALYEQIIEQGTLLSEFLPRTKAKPYQFPMRNRLISGLAKSLIVVEAGLRSGTMITAQCALDQNRDVYAIPGSIFMENSQGCHQLINEGAKIVMNLQEISYIGSTKKFLIHPVQEKILEHISYFEPNLNQLINFFHLPLPELLRHLGALQKAGLIIERAGHYLLNRKDF